MFAVVFNTLRILLKNMLGIPLTAQGYYRVLNFQEVFEKSIVVWCIYNTYVGIYRIL